MIRLRNVSYQYGPDSEPVLHALNLDIGPGEKIAIMGSNGSGKSTLARVIAGLTEPTRGEVITQGRPSKETPVTAGFLFQNPDNQMVAMTVGREVAFALENRGVPFADMRPRVAQSLEQFGVGPLEERLTNELSGGEKQRVALAATMIYNPLLLILDEPDSFLDSDGRARLHAILDELSRQNPKLIVIRVTQYEKVARRYDRLLLLDAGKLRADDSPDTVLAQTAPINRFPIEPDLKLLQLNRRPDSERASKLVVDSMLFGYGAQPLLTESLSFSLSAGETVGLFGPTGSGKSTLGLALCGLSSLISGSRMLFMADGRETRSVPPGLIVGVMQFPERQFFLPTCAEEISFGPRNRGIILKEKQIDRYFELVGLEPIKFVTRDPLSLSIGEKRRLAFAAILSLSPSFIVFDEPTASLDAEGVARFKALSRTLKQIGLGQVIISHERSVISELTDWALCLPGDGSVSKVDDSSRLDDSPLARFLA